MFRRDKQVPQPDIAKVKREKASVTVDPGCYESLPCQHDYTVHYKDGSTKQKCGTPKDIVAKYRNYLDTPTVSQIDCFFKPLKQTAAQNAGDEDKRQAKMFTGFNR